MNVRQAELSRTVDRALLGRRIRNARIAAGLTQGQLAKAAAVTTAYISRIESGDRRPEATRLEAMSAALGADLDSLIGPEEAERTDLALRIKLDHAQLALSAGSIQEADAAATEILDEVETSRDFERFRWQAEFIRCLCFEANGRLDDAIVGLERVASTPQADAAWIKVLIALSRCYREAGDTTRAIAVGENAMTQLEELGLSRVTEAVQLSVTVAMAYSVRGDIDHAARICLRAIEDAVSIGSPVAQASAYWNASIMESHRGHAEAAVTLAGKALSLFDLADDRRNMSRLRTELALLQLKMDPPQVDEAMVNVELGWREMEWSTVTPTDRATNRMVAARVRAARGEIEEALEELDEVLKLEPAAAPLMVAYARVARGQWLADLGRVGEAITSFHDAVLLASTIGADREAAQFWFELGDLFDRVGEGDAARDAYRRAAASTGLTAQRASQLR